MKRKSSIMLIVLMFLCSNFGGIRVHAADKTQNVDAEINVLTVLGIADENTFYQETVTRLEFIKAAVKLIDKSITISGMANIGFSDVSSESEDYPELCLAVAAGLIENGESFRPNDAITKQEAAKILVCVLGYGEYALVRGEYPKGYDYVAEQLGITDGVGYNITGNDFAKMLVQTLEASPISVSAVTSQGELNFSIKGEETLMERCFSMYKSEGLVDANEFTSLYSTESVNDGFVRIDDILYQVDNSGADDMLGVYAEFFYIKDTSSDINKIISITEKTKYCDIYQIFSADIMNNSTTEEIIYRNEKNIQKKYKINANASFIYNDLLTAKDDRVLNIKPDSGYVLLIDNDRDNTADVVKIYDYRTMVVASKSDDAKILSGKNGVSINLGEQDDYYSIKKNEEIISFEEINKGDTVSYYETFLGERYVRRLLVSDKVIENKIDSIDDERVYIGEENYLYNADILSQLKVGVMQKLYIDALNHIAYADITDDEYAYGWLQWITYDWVEPVKVKLFTHNGNCVFLELKEKIKYNGVTVLSERFYNDMISLSEYGQLLRYKVNKEAVIYQIDTAIDTVRFTPAESAAISQDIFRRSVNMTDKIYRGGTDSIENQVFPDENTKIICVPMDDSDDEAYTTVSSLGEIYGYDENIKSISAYDMSRLGVPKVIVIREDSIKKRYDDLFIVQKVKNSYSEQKDEANHTVVGKFRGYDVEFSTETVDTLSGNMPSGGDVLRVSFTLDGNIESVSKSYDNSKIGEQKFIIGSEYDKNGYVAGIVEDIDFEEGIIAIDTGKINLYKLAVTNLYIYDESDMAVEKAEINDILKGDQVFMRVSYYRCMELIIYR